MSLKKIGILTTGGDCSGLNSVIRAAYQRANILGYELLGIKRGLRGLDSASPDYIKLNDDICNETLLTVSGSILYSDTAWIKATIKSGKTITDIKKTIADGYKAMELEGVIYVGGDGSLNLMNELLTDNSDLNIVAVPKTIDNDVGATDFSIGFKTAVEVVAESIENIRSTAKSHERTMVVEVMGRDAGFIAMYAGIATGADIVLVPEFKYCFEKVKEKVKACYDAGKNHCIIIVAEAVEAEGLKHDEEVINGITKFTQLKYNGIGNHIASELKKSGFDSRSVTLGHTQRGGKTSIDDRIIGSAFGVEAVNLINSSNCGRLLCYRGGEVTNVLISDIVGKINKTLTKTDICVNIANNLGIYIGEV